MNWRVILLLSALLVVTASGVPTGEICKMCSCFDVTVSCDCFKNSKIQNLFIDENSLSDSSSLKKFEVLGCQSLTLRTNAFRNAHALQTVHVNRVENASFEIGVFQSLESLIIDSVNSLILKKSAFQGAKGIYTILIKNSRIPVVTEWALYNITGLNEFRMEQTRIEKIEKDAVMIDLLSTQGSVSIKQCTFGKIEEKGVQISNANSINITECLIKEGDSKSIRLSSRQFMVLKGNTFEEKVNADAVLMQFMKKLEFTSNVLKNIDISISEHSNIFLNQTSQNLDRLVFENIGNQIPCKCPEYISNRTAPFFQNLCIGSCQEATILAFLDHCDEKNNTSAEAILKDICRGKLPLTTPAIPTAVPIISTTPKSGSSPLNGNNKIMNVMFLLLMFFCIFK